MHANITTPYIYIEGIYIIYILTQNYVSPTKMREIAISIAVDKRLSLYRDIPVYTLDCHKMIKISIV